MPAVVVAALLAVLYLALDPPSADLAAHTYRVGLFDHAGWTVWDNGWYGGHHLPAYSVLFPPLGSLLGLRVVAALSLVGGTAAFAGVARRTLPRQTGPSLWFAAALAASILSGRLPFALGVAVGAGALLAATRGRWAAAGLLGAATTLCSPVAGLFLALVGTAWWLGAARPRPRLALVLAGAAVAAGAVVVLAFPEGGSEPFVASAFWPALAAVAVGLALAPAGPVRIGLALYALVLVAAFAIATPLGGNAARLGALAAGPLAAALLADRRRVLALASLPLAYWVLYPAVRDWSAAAGDPAQPAAYYAPLLAELRRVQAHRPPARLEIPFTKGHWESARVAPVIPLARGWERQLDRLRNGLFYDGPLTASRYRRWLADNAIGWVALADAPLDPSARREAALVRAGLPYLRPVWRSAHWRLFAVEHATPLGASRLGADWFTTTGGLVRVHWTRYWALQDGHGCVRRAAGDWTLVTPATTGATVRVGIDVTPGRALSGSARCR
ncbi:MAG: hypothetical protein QOF12_1773 [Solirubrobacteraceae bacterium]|nr:hypothetical protein [Solirubrobacteraceae bacterium]